MAPSSPALVLPGYLLSLDIFCWSSQRSAEVKAEASVRSRRAAGAVEKRGAVSRPVGDRACIGKRRPPV